MIDRYCRLAWLKHEVEDVETMSSLGFDFRSFALARVEYPYLCPRPGEGENSGLTEMFRTRSLVK